MSWVDSLTDDEKRMLDANIERISVLMVKHHDFTCDLMVRAAEAGMSYRDASVVLAYVAGMCAEMAGASKPEVLTFPLKCGYGSGRSVFIGDAKEEVKH